MNGFTRSLDRKIEASKRRQAEEQKRPSRAPTEGLTDLASTPSCNVPARSVPLGGQISVKQAMDRLKLAMQQDPDFARAWHDNIAMAFMDEAYTALDESEASLRKVANAAAIGLMQQAFEVDTKPAEPIGSVKRAFKKVKVDGPIKNTNAHSLDAQLAMAKAAEPGGLNEQKARYFASLWDGPVKADLCDAKGVTIQRLMTSAELEAAAPHENYDARVREILKQQYNVMPTREEIEAILQRDVAAGCGIITLDAR